MGFSLEPDDPNVLARGKGPIHTLITYMVMEWERLRILGGTPWSRRALQEGRVDGDIRFQEIVQRTIRFHSES